MRHAQDTTSDDQADLKVIAREQTCVLAVPSYLCQGKTTMFLHMCYKIICIYVLSRFTKWLCQVHPPETLRHKILNCMVYKV